MGGFQREVRPNETDYIPSILPKGFALPPECRYIGLPSAEDGDHPAVVWRFDCGAAANLDARGTLQPAFTQQGWSPCSPAIAPGTWAKDTSRLTVTEASSASGGFPTLTQRLYYYGGGGPPGAATAGCR